MLGMYVMDRPSKWDDYLYLVEFTYNNGYHASMKMSLFESLYGKKCNTQVSWDNLVDRVVIGSYMLKIDWNVIEIELEGDFQVQPVCILDQKVTVLSNLTIR